MIKSKYKNTENNDITPETLVKAYCMGYFPMAEEDGIIEWHKPEMRAIFPLSDLKFSRSLRRTINKSIFDCTYDTCFTEVMYQCAMTRKNETWISDVMLEAYSELHRLGLAHSVEIWQGERLVGGLYGVSLGGMFCGESMFNLVRDAAKVAFFYLVQQLKQQEFVLLDSQYLNDFTAQLGAIEVPEAQYEDYKDEALMLKRTFL